MNFFACGFVKAENWGFPFGFSYVSGFGDIMDITEDNLETEYSMVKSVEGVPIGLIFRPHFQLDNGLEIGADFDPFMMIYGDVDFFNLPVNMNCRYTFIPKSKVSPYIRAGVSYHLANGDYVVGKSAGFLGGIGFEFFNMGLEVSYDTSEIEIENLSHGDSTENIKPCEWALSFFFLF
ncbi:MAG: hypothetical protein DRI57_14155 [Deltaproteobacteria bacterium]|nr:MAG: hypothetical protein DRI57_14155 [Deltaproteobacteria bacterium]